MSLLVLSVADVDAAFSSFHPNEIEIILARTFIDISTSSDIFSPPPTKLTPQPARRRREIDEDGRGRDGSVPQNRRSPATIWPFKMETFGSACRVVASSGDPDRGLQSRSTTLLLGDGDGEALQAVVNTRRLTAYRIAAGSVLATRMLKTVGDMNVLAIIGMGFEMQVNIRLHLACFPGLSSVLWIVDEQETHADERVGDFRAAFPGVLFNLVQFTEIEEATEILKTADIICTSNSIDFMAPDIKVHTHINLIGTHEPCLVEVGDELLLRAGSVVVDSTADMIREAEEQCEEDVENIAGDKLYEIGRLVSISDDDDVIIDAELGNEIRGDGDVTIFKSAGFGSGVHDLPLLNAVVKRAILNNRGTLVGDFDA